jgi:Protein of unknown function (DUF3455)
MSSTRATFIVPFVVALSAVLHADSRITPPAVPADIEAPAGTRPFFRAHAVGTQNYICAPAATAAGVEWLMIGPQATLFDENVEQVVTHFASRNPSDGDAIQPTWQHSRDTSAVWAVKMKGSSDPAYVAADAIEWLLLRVSGRQTGPTGGDKLARAMFIQRVNTSGGVKPPSAECTMASLNTRKLVRYEADYYFYE